ncbi:MAG TPA: TIM barrel protein [Actinoplanes sp.]
MTLRDHGVDEVVDIAATAGLAGIEWGADRHVRPGDPAAARTARDACARAGLRVCSYGSYFRAGVHEPDRFAAVLDSARRLGAPRIRIWAGAVGSGEATADERAVVVRTTRAIAGRAADAGITLAFEYHGGTLADDADSTLALLDEIGHGAVGTYWQPPVGVPDDAALDGLRRLMARVVAVHVFSWWPGDHRRSLPARGTLWRPAFRLLRDTGRDVDALLEFVPDDDAASIGPEAAALAELIAAGGSPVTPIASAVGGEQALDADDDRDDAEDGEQQGHARRRAALVLPRRPASGQAVPQQGDADADPDQLEVEQAGP